MDYSCPGCGATDDEKKSCCGADEAENTESTENAEVSGTESGLEEEFEKE